MSYEDIENIYENENPQGIYNIDEGKVYSEEIDEINTDLIEGIERSFYLGTTDVLGIPYTRVKPPQPITPPRPPSLTWEPDEREEPEPILIDFVIDGTVAQFWPDQVGLMRGSGYEHYIKSLAQIPLVDDWSRRAEEINCFHLINVTAQQNVLIYISEILNNYMTYKLSAGFAGKRPETRTYDLVSSGHADCTYIFNGSFGMNKQRHDRTNYIYDGFKHNHMLSIIRSYNILHVLYFNEHYQQRYIRKKGIYDSAEGTFKTYTDQWTAYITDVLTSKPRPEIKDPCCTVSASNNLPAFSPFVRYIKYWEDENTSKSFSEGIWDYAITPTSTRIRDHQLNNIVRSIFLRIKNRVIPEGEASLPTTDIKFANGSTWNTLTENFSYQKTTETPSFDGSTIFIKITEDSLTDEIDISSFKYTNENDGRTQVPPWCRVAGEQKIEIEFPSIRIDVEVDDKTGYYLWRNPTFTLTISRLSAGDNDDESSIFWNVATERGIRIGIEDNGMPGESNEWKFHNIEDNEEYPVNIPQNSSSGTTLRLGKSILGAGAKYPLVSSSDNSNGCTGVLHFENPLFNNYPDNHDKLSDLSYVYGANTRNRRTELHTTERSSNIGTNPIYTVVSSRDKLNYYIKEVGNNVRRKIYIKDKMVNRYTNTGRCYDNSDVYAKTIITTFEYLHQIIQTQMVVPHPVFLIRDNGPNIKRYIYNSKAINGICGQYTNYNPGNDDCPYDDINCLYDGFYSRLSISSPLFRGESLSNIEGFEAEQDPLKDDFYDSIPTGTANGDVGVRAAPTLDNVRGIIIHTMSSGTTFKAFAKVVSESRTWYLIEVENGAGNVVNGWIRSNLVNDIDESNIPFTCDPNVRESSYNTDEFGMGLFKLYEHLTSLSTGSRKPSLRTSNNDTST